MALASEPRLLLLDEPMAGHGAGGIRAHGADAARAQRQLTILLIEHDMEAVFALADRITVLVYGRIIASGAPDAIRADADVRHAYLGEQERRGDMAERTLLEVAGIETSYGLSRCCSAFRSRIARGRDGDAAWAATAWARPRPCARSWG